MDEATRRKLRCFLQVLGLLLGSCLIYTTFIRSADKKSASTGLDITSELDDILKSDAPLSLVGSGLRGNKKSIEANFDDITENLDSLSDLLLKHKMHNINMVEKVDIGGLKLELRPVAADKVDSHISKILKEGKFSEAELAEIKALVEEYTQPNKIMKKSARLLQDTGSTGSIKPPLGNVQIADDHFAVMNVPLTLMGELKAVGVDAGKNVKGNFVLLPTIGGASVNVELMHGVTYISGSSTSSMQMSLSNGLDEGTSNGFCQITFTGLGKPEGENYYYEFNTATYNADGKLINIVPTLIPAKYFGEDGVTLDKFLTASFKIEGIEFNAWKQKSEELYEKLPSLKLDPLTMKSANEIKVEWKKRADAANAQFDIAYALRTAGVALSGTMLLLMIIRWLRSNRTQPEVRIVPSAGMGGGTVTPPRSGGTVAAVASQPLTIAQPLTVPSSIEIPIAIPISISDNMTRDTTTANTASKTNTATTASKTNTATTANKANTAVNINTDKKTQSEEEIRSVPKTKVADLIAQYQKAAKSNNQTVSNFRNPKAAENQPRQEGKPKKGPGSSV